MDNLPVKQAIAIREKNKVLEMLEKFLNMHGPKATITFFENYKLKAIKLIPKGKYEEKIFEGRVEAIMYFENEFIPKIQVI